MTSWLLVADSRHAKIFTIEDARFALIEVADFKHPLANQRGGNPAGHVFAAASGTRHGLEPATLSKEKDVHAFAVELGQYLQHEFSQRHFSKLTVAAAPEFLGELRATLPENVRSSIATTIDKNLLLYSDAELTTYLREYMSLH